MKANKKLIITFSILFICATCVIFSACSEGKNPVGGHNFYFQGHVYGDARVDENGDLVGNPIAGIKVISDYGYTKSDANGKFAILSYSMDGYKRLHTIAFEDVDGEENGLFKNQTIQITDYDVADVFLERQ